MRAETGQAVLAATAHLAPAANGPGLSDLAARIATFRGLPDLPVTIAASPAGADRRLPAPLRPLETATAGLVSPPPVDGRIVEVDPWAVPPSSVGLLAAHGGAGVSTLLRCGLLEAGAVDVRRRWPAGGPVLLVARTATAGLEAARDLARQHASGTGCVDVRLVGLVLVADAPGRLPARVRELADLVCGAFARTWHVPWVEEWRLAACDEPLPGHPEVSRLLSDVQRLSTAPSDPTRSPTRGVLL